MSMMSVHGLSPGSWRVDDIDGGLAADFDGSLSGLGVELGTMTYNMSQALLALPVFKQDHIDQGFQFVLGAATSPATKLNEETLTYLNQGQSYEIKVKKLGDLSDCQGKIFKSVVKVAFHDRRLQYMEHEQIDSWKQYRPGERILDIDVPLSYGLVDIRCNPGNLNRLEFLWDPTKETGIFIKVNSISTEFTPKKHGGEKGVPFRIQIDTFTNEDEEAHGRLLHCAGCQVKVFKPKGADRKHKTDREKMEKKSQQEKDKYQLSYECTVLTELPIDQAIHHQNSFSDLKQALTQSENSPSARGRSPGNSIGSAPSTPSSSISSLSLSTVPLVGGALSPDTSAQDVSQWLHTNRFSNYIRVFQNFSGADLLRLTRDDLIQICGLADGIRLNNALQYKAVRPRMTIYVCQEHEQVYHALYLDNLTAIELVQRLSHLFNCSPSKLKDVYTLGPSGIHILLTDEVVQNIKEECRFAVQLLQDDGDSYGVILKEMV